MDVVTLGAALSIMKKMPDTAASSAAAAEDAADRAEEAARILTIDDTLSESGQAADAKVVGDEISDLKSDLYESNTIKTKYNPINIIETATVGSSGIVVGGMPGTNVYVFKIDAGTSVVVNGGTVYGYFAESPVKNTTVTTDSTRHIETLSNKTITMPTGAYYLAVVYTATPLVIGTELTTDERVDALEDNFDVFANANDGDISEFTQQVSKYVGGSQAITPDYYRTVNAFDTAKTYNLIITVPQTGQYTIQAGASGSASAMVDTIYNGTLIKGKTLVAGYAPSGAYTYIRNSAGGTWDIEVYERFSGTLAGVVANHTTAFSKTPMVKTITAQQFAASPYNSSIGNLDINSIVNITNSYGAVDYPYGNANYYTIITTGDSASPIQIAVRIDGKTFTRKRGGSGWYAWDSEALEYSNLQLSGSSPAYTDFNDFPIGSILSVDALKLTNSPEGDGNTGHASMDSGVISAVVMTYATKHDDPTMIAQTCLYYRNVSQGTPRIAYRTALLYNGSYIWTNWSTLSQDGVIHSTNKIVDIDHLDYTFDDFDDAPANTIYQVDLNVANAVAHNPAPGKSGSLMTYGFSDSSRHALTQIYIALDNSAPNMYFRYGVINSSTQYLWTSWYRVTATQV